MTDAALEHAAYEWRMVLATERDKRRIRVAINRGLGLPDNASVSVAGYACHVTDGRPVEEQAAAYYAAYLTLEPLPDVQVSDERRQIADWLDAEANRADVNGFEPNDVAQRIRDLAVRLRTGVDAGAEAAMVQSYADSDEAVWRRRNEAMPKRAGR